MWLNSAWTLKSRAEETTRNSRYCMLCKNKLLLYVLIFQNLRGDMNVDRGEGRHRGWLKVWQYGTNGELTQGTNSNNIMGCIPCSEEAPAVWIADRYLLKKTIWFRRRTELMIISRFVKRATIRGETYSGRVKVNHSSESFFLLQLLSLSSSLNVSHN